MYVREINQMLLGSRSSREMALLLAESVGQDLEVTLWGGWKKVLSQLEMSVEEKDLLDFPETISSGRIWWGPKCTDVRICSSSVLTSSPGGSSGGTSCTYISINRATKPELDNGLVTWDRQAATQMHYAKNQAATITCIEIVDEMAEKFRTEILAALQKNILYTILLIKSSTAELLGLNLLESIAIARGSELIVF